MLLSNKKVHIFPDFSFADGYMGVYGHYTPVKETSLVVVQFFYSTEQNYDFLENFSLDNYWGSKSQACINERLRGNKLNTLTRYYTKVCC